LKHIFYVFLSSRLVLNIYELIEKKFIFYILLTDECISDMDSSIFVTLMRNQIFKNDKVTETTFFLHLSIEGISIKTIVYRTKSTFQNVTSSVWVLVHHLFAFLQKLFLRIICR